MNSQKYTKVLQKHNIRTTIKTVVAITWLIIILVISGNRPAQAHGVRHHICVDRPIPRKVCRVLVKGAKAAHVPVSWAWSGDLAFILRHESGFDWCAVNPGRHLCSYRGASSSCGLFQRLPCVTVVFRSRLKQAVNGLLYVKNRYGSPKVAVAYWKSHRYY